MTAVILLILILIKVKASNFSSGKNIQSANYLDKKCGSRLICLQQEPKLQNKILLPLSDFKELTRIADEKDLSILKFNKTNLDINIYLAIDGESIFNYAVSSVETAESQAATSFTLGSDVFNG